MTLVDVNKAQEQLEKDRGARDHKLAEAVEKIKKANGAVLIWLDGTGIGVFHFEEGIRNTDLLGSIEFVKLNLARIFMESEK